MNRAQIFITAVKKFQKLLEQTQEKVFPEAELINLIEENRSKWDLPTTVAANKLLRRFVDQNLFRIIELQVGERKTIRYIIGEPSIYEIAVSLRSKSYISHFPALLLNGLTNQIPKTIYLTHELSQKAKVASTLSQQAIDKAFSKPQRRSELSTIYEDYKIIFLETKNSNRIGVTNKGIVHITNMERTLIDSTVRPNYSGGCFIVLEAYREALSKNLSLNKIVAILNKLDYIYPYNQAVGFYLERAGYKGGMIEMLRRKEMHFDFYLDYNLEEKEYSPEWRIYYPKGLPDFRTI
jgi:predicted transcriptional regulator of viral defense system